MLIDAVKMKEMFLSGAKALDAEQEWINELNVFPVPDGDTGTNMTMTIMSAAKEVLNVEEVTSASICKAISSGALRGARGNSGVILSQLFRGFAKHIQKNEYQEIGVPEIADAMEKATETAYKAVMKPKEGTILTVQKGMSDKANELRDMTDIAEFMEAVAAYGDEVLKKTPEMLPVLKQAGVVDSGGQGLMVVLHAMIDAYKGNVLEFTEEDLNGGSKGSSEKKSVDTTNLDTSDIKFGYCTEFIIKLKNPMPDQEVNAFKDYLSSIGDSIVCVADDEIVKIHVHTNDPGLAIQRALTYGELSRMKIDNMREEHEERLFKNAEEMAKKQAEEPEMPHKEMGFITVCAGVGLKQIFEDLGADYVIEGGQTMNPSTEDFLKAIEKVNADTIFVLPNNKNVILAAEQAAQLVENKVINVIPTGTVCQGLTCLINFDATQPADANLETMTEAIPTVKTIEVTYAIRDTIIDGVEVHKNDFMALSGKSIVSAGTDLTEVVKAAVGKSVDDESALVSLYYGGDVTEEAANDMTGMLAEAFPDVEVEANFGGQPVYYYIISVE